MIALQWASSLMSPATAIEMGRLGGLGVLNLEGLWTRYADPEPLLEEIAAIDDPGAATRRMQELYAEPIKEELIGQRVDHVPAAVQVQEVQMGHHGGAALPAYLVGRRLPTLLVAKPGDADVHPGPGERHRRRLPDSGLGPGDDGSPGSELLLRRCHEWVSWDEPARK